LNKIIEDVKNYLDEQKIEPEEIENFLGYIITYLILK
jgi:hypothetical protein